MVTTGCQCSKPKYKLVFSCSGAADVGAISDLTARELKQNKVASMCCTAAIGAAIPEILETAKNAEKILAIDGCDKDCAKIILNQAGFTHFNHLQLENLGMIKGETPATEAYVEKAYQVATELLTTEKGILP